MTGTTPAAWNDPGRGADAGGRAVGDDVARALQVEQRELLLAGAQVTPGYWQDAERTAKAFVVPPGETEVFYRTGDRVRWPEGGPLLYLGRVDNQVKIQGYRVELGEIEAVLREHATVREAVVALRTDGGAARLVAYVTPRQDRVDLDGLRSTLAQKLPDYMVPAALVQLTALPLNANGKLDRRALPVLSGGRSVLSGGEFHPPAGEMEELLAAGYSDILRRAAVSVEDDFFTELGGDSLSAAMLVTLLRDDSRTAWITVSDIYEARSVRALARLAPDGDGAEPGPAATLQREGHQRLWLANMVQLSWLTAELFVAGWAGWLAAFKLLPLLFEDLGLVPFVLLAPVFALVALTLYVPVSVLFAVMVKRLVIGRYRALRTPVWSGYYLRHWVVQQAARLIPWPLLQGTQAQQWALRLLGARIGRNVHIHRGVDLSRGGWDLLEIGDDAAVGQDCQLSLTELDRGDLVVGPVALEAGATMQVRAGLSGHCRMGGFFICTPRIAHSGAGPTFCTGCAPHPDAWRVIKIGRWRADFFHQTP